MAANTVPSVCVLRFGIRPFLKGHGFSRAVDVRGKRPLGPEAVLLSAYSRDFWLALTARLKGVPL
jgi:hypothetical protein